ncbi:hypothetical protein [Haematobacter genomosp. 1]|uniref:Uncharacterized protein n=1 Tax=Haematobacter genomosp. 1 TaxID=366618 RepID=A0A212AC32_9RHOB|nr:hypothetical protein [Haematobacter genomosp. 1]OWJ78440.1 hypothetical protein CDV49_08365 [Haematobacter genomosp. 1]
MTRKELERHGALLFGAAWKGRIASALDVNRKTVSRWIADDAVAPWAAEKIRALAHIAPPPGSSDMQDRDSACVHAIEPELTRLRDIAVSAGWHPAEVAAAILALTIDEIQAHVGSEETIKMLNQACGGALVEVIEKRSARS